MSPLLLRRYRAERMLRQDFQALRGTVLVGVRGRLRARGVHLDSADLEACYAQAWHGLYAAVLADEQVLNPTGWLVHVTFRRAIDEYRARLHEDRGELAPDTIVAMTVGSTSRPKTVQPDLAGEIDDRDRLRHIFEALRGRLNPRECQAASLCYLQGLSRSQAAAQMGISEVRMRKLMEGDARKGPGVAGKVGELLATIEAGGWCEQQASQMRALAFGILDSDGERYRLAQLHSRECPACRAYVRSLRGLAAVLPPLGLPWGLGLGALTGAGTGAAGGSAVGVGAGSGAAGGGVSAGALSASGVASVGGAGGGWLLAGGSVGAKLAVGCLLALGFGAGCVALTRGPHRTHPAHRHALGAVRPARSGPPAPSPAVAAARPALGSTAGVARSAAVDPGRSAAAQTQRAQREFGPERTNVRTPSTATVVPGARPASISKTSPRAGSATRSASSQGTRAARREFGAG